MAFMLAAWLLAATGAAALALRGRTRHAGAAVLAAFALAGAAWWTLDDIPSSDDLARSVGPGRLLVKLRARVREVPLPPHPEEPDPRPGQLVIDVLAVEDGGVWRVRSSRSTLRVTGRHEELWPDDELDLLCTVRVPEAARTPGGYDRREALAREGIGLEADAFGPNVRVASRGGLSLGRSTAMARAHLAGRLRRCLSREYSELLCALLLGHRPGVDPQQRAIFARSGMGHLLAISGLHLAILVGLLGAALRWVRLGRRPTAVILACFAVLYAVLAGGRTPVARAAVMITTYLAAVILDRDRDLANSVAFAALVLIVHRPKALFDPGFQLSFSAVAFIAFLYPLLEEAYAAWRGDSERWMEPLAENRFERACRRMRQALFVSAAAWLGVQPLLLHYLGFVNPWAVFSNVAVLPLATLALAAGVTLLVAGAAWLPLAAVLAYPARAAIWALLVGVELFARLPWSIVRLSSPGAAWLVGYYALALGMFAWAWRRRRPHPEKAVPAVPAGARGRRMAVWIGVAAGAFALTGAVLVFIPPEGPPAPSVTAFDMGRGRAVLVTTSGGEHVLVNAGAPGAGQALDDWLRRLGIDSLAAVVLTRDDDDHASGLGGAIEDRGVGVLALPALSRRSEAVLAATRTAVDRGAAVLWPRPGDWIGGGEGGPGEAHWLGTRPWHGGTPHAAVAFNAGGGLDAAFFEPGSSDSPERADELARSLAGGDLVPGGVLVVFASRAGARAARTVVRAARPRLVVVCLSETDAVLPGTALLLRTLVAEGVPVVRTDLSGTVRVRTTACLPSHRQVPADGAPMSTDDGHAPLVVERWESDAWIEVGAPPRAEAAWGGASGLLPQVRAPERAGDHRPGERGAP